MAQEKEEGTAGYLLERPLKLKGTPEPESYSPNKLITAALTLLVLGGIIWPFHSTDLKNVVSVPISILTPEISETPVTTVIPVVTIPEAQTTGKKIGINLDRDKGFSQSTLAVKPGDEVVWINDGLYPVTIISSDDLFEAKLLDNDKRINYIFNKSGIYGFYLDGKNNLNMTIVIEP